MLRSEAARYARWSATVALVLAVVTGIAYLQRSWKGSQEREKAPPSAPVNVERQSNALAFSQSNGKQKIFTVEASKSTDFRGKDASLLEAVKITIFGKQGERHDTIRTQSCQYSKTDGSMVCSGEVQMDLESAADAQHAAADPLHDAHVVRVKTREVTFDRARGIANTTQPVSFIFPNGTGSAVGVHYESEQGSMRLVKDVRFALNGPVSKLAPGNPQHKEEILLQGTSLDFARDSRTIRLHGPVDVQTPTQRLTAGEITLELSPQYFAEKLMGAAGQDTHRPELTSKGPHSPLDLTADRLTVQFSPEGSVTSAQALGRVHGARQNDAGSTEEFSAQQALLTLWPKVSQPQELMLEGGVSLQSQTGKAGGSRTLRTNALRIRFTPPAGPHGSKLQQAETLTAGTLEWSDARQDSGAPPRTSLKADKLQIDFDPFGQAKMLTASGNLETERTLPDRLPQTATAKSGVAQLLPTGGWSRIDLQGEIKLREGDRSARADHLLLQNADQSTTLTGGAMVRDGTAETHAQRILFMQKTGDIRATGGVRSTNVSPGKGGPQFAPIPANLASDTLEANSQSGRARYTGHARFWQGESVLEADSIELLRDARQINAEGHVRAVFPQVDTKRDPHAPAVRAGPRKMNLWHVTAGNLSYSDSENRARLEHHVQAQSTGQTFNAAVLELFFTRPSPAPAADINSSAKLSGAQQISRAVGTGGVTVEEGSRRAVAERGEYTAADGKFVMSGGNPTIYDGSSGSTSGRQLTFFLADDTIIVDSEQGSRILTKHRVDK